MGSAVSCKSKKGSCKPQNKTANIATSAQRGQSEELEEHMTAVLASSPVGCEALRCAICDLEADSAAASELQLSSRMIEDAGVVKLAKGLAKSTHLQVLNLSINHITDVGAQALAGVLAATKLRVLMLERNQLSAVGIVALARALPKTLEKLVLGRNSVGVEGASALASSAVRLHTLSLGFAQLHAEGGRALASILSKLIVLDVAGNHLGGAGCAFLSDRLEESTLDTLKLESNGIGDAGAKALCTALERCKTLQVLEIRRNSVTDEGAKLLAHALERNQTLRHLDLFDNSITDVGAGALLVAVRKTKQAGSMLSVLNLQINDVSPSTTARITEALQKRVCSSA